MDDIEKTRTGRQALFKGTEKKGPESDKIPVSEISEMIDRIRVYQGDEPVPQVSELWAPVIGIL